MNIFLNQTKKLILSKQGSIFSSAILIAGMIVFSRLFGFLRFRILATYFSKEQLDIFFASFRIPDLVFELLITGSLSSAFIPLIIKYQKDKNKFNFNISSIINLVLLTMFLLIFILIILSDKIIPLVTLGYSQEKINQIVFFSKILLIGQLPLLIAGNLLIGLAQAYKFFILTSFAPILYNIFIILCTIFLASNFQLLAPIIGVLLGAFFFFFSQFPVLFRIEFKYLPVLQINNAVKDFIKVIIPRLLTVLTAQIDATIDLTLTTFLGSGSYTIFYFAQHLQLLPVSVIGMAFGQASLP
ncbi:MAG: murein biosynthesis integral membrane protein MurJ, partial [Microgenomates group bacterium]